jgi:hypothetical protein
MPFSIIRAYARIVQEASWWKCLLSLFAARVARRLDGHPTRR